MKTFSIFLSILVVAALSYFVLPRFILWNPLAQYDLKQLCKMSEPFNEKLKTDADKLTVHLEFMDLAMKSIKSDAARNIIDALGMTSEAQRWQIFMAGASEVGLKDFNCESLQNVILARP